VLFGANARGRLRKRVERDLSATPAWQVVTAGRWVCPYCATPALKVSGSAEVEAVLDHLEECADHQGGEGRERPLAELRRVAAQRELRRRVKRSLVSNPSWQLIDFSQRWFCPFCGDPTNVTVPRDRKMTEETLQGILGHVQSCYGYDRGKGKEKPFAHLKSTVKYHNQSRKLAENVRRKLEGDPAWRRKDPSSRWICPYCMEPQSHIDLSSNLLMFENAPSLIAKHLAAGCEQFRSGGHPRPLAPGEVTKSGAGPALELAPGSGVGMTPEAAPIRPPPSQRSSTSREGLLDAPIPDTDPHGLGRPSRRVKPAPEPTLLPPKPRAQQPEGDSTPSGRYRKTLWGADGVAAGGRTRGTTLRQLEESGEFTLINDPEVRSLTGGPGPRESGSDARSVKSVDRWRREIEEELKQVRSLSPLARSGELSALSGSQSDEADPDAGLARRLGFADRGVELRRIEYRASTPRGDFVEALELGPDRIALVAGGVAGEDAEAALISALVRNLIRAHAGPNQDPGTVLQRVNADVFGDLDGRSLVAVTYVLIDLVGHRGRLARAGATAPVLVNPARNPSLVPLDCEGMVMGIDRGPIFDSSLEVRSLELRRGDTLVLFTKGIIEARGSQRKEFGLGRMHRLIERYGTHEAAYFVDKFREYFGMHVPSDRRAVDGAVLAFRRAEPDG
jgi:hypothetical protein